MSQLGERLRVARESQGINLAQAAAETRILQRYLVAIEDGDYKNLPGDVYARGFIRNYARYLGVSAEESIDRYRFERGKSEPIRIIPATSAPRVRGYFIPSFFGVFFVVLALVGISYLVLSATNRIGESAQPIAVAPLQSTSVATPLPLPTIPPASTQQPVVAAAPSATFGPAGSAPTPTPPPTPQPEAPITLEVRIDPGDNPGSWLHIKTDDVSVFQKVLGPGKSLNYTAQRKIWIRAGNAAFVSVTVNGQEQRLSTSPGEVVTFTWPP